MLTWGNVGLREYNKPVRDSTNVNVHAAATFAEYRKHNEVFSTSKQGLEDTPKFMFRHCRHMSEPFQWLEWADGRPNAEGTAIDTELQTWLERLQSGHTVWFVAKTPAVRGAAGGIRIELYYACV